MLDKMKPVIKSLLYHVYARLRGITVPGHCAVCGSSARFIRSGDNLRETFICSVCGSNSRNRHLAMVLFDTLGLMGQYSLKRVVESFQELKIYETQASGSIHSVLRDLDGYVCSEYFTDVPPGSFSRKGIRCEDIQDLSFEDNSFDIVITQDVFEHVRIPDLAWKEICRVLKPSGFHIFTVPFLTDRKTVRRVEIDGDKDIFVLPKVFHGDSIRNGLVYTDFGYDLLEHLESIGLPTDVFSSDDLQEEDVKQYRVYRSCVFVSRIVQSS